MPQERIRTMVIFIGFVVVDWNVQLGPLRQAFLPFLGFPLAFDLHFVYPCLFEFFRWSDNLGNTWICTIKKIYLKLDEREEKKVVSCGLQPHWAQA